MNARQFLAAALFAVALILSNAIVTTPAMATPTDNGTYSLVPYGCDDPENPLADTDLTCFQLVIHCGPTIDIPRYDCDQPDIEIRERLPTNPPVGAVLFFSGDMGDDYYGHIPYSEDTVATLRASGYRTYEARWLDVSGVTPGDGWLSGADGFGPEMATCGAREVIEWIKENRAINFPLCATGNSFGGVQIAYAVAAHGAGPFLKSAVYSAGPSVADIPKGCFGPTYDNGLLSGTPSITVGFHINALRWEIIDRVMGWRDPANDCGTDSAHPGFASTYNTPAAQAMALVSYGPDAVPGDRDYAPATRQHFVEAALDGTGATVQGSLYYNAVTGTKTLSPITFANQDTPGSDDFVTHTLHNTETGSRLIREILLDPANCQ